jgi:hypothetical protein
MEVVNHQNIFEDMEVGVKNSCFIIWVLGGNLKLIQHKRKQFIRLCLIKTFSILVPETLQHFSVIMCSYLVLSPGNSLFPLVPVIYATN